MKMCRICGKDIIDEGEIPVYVMVTGWTLDDDGEPEYQYSIDVCKDCFENNPMDILHILEDKSDDYR